MNRHILVQAVSVCALLVIACGCRTVPRSSRYPVIGRTDPFFAEWQARAEASRRVAPDLARTSIEMPDTAAPEEAVVTVPVVAPSPPLPTQEVTLRMQKADVGAVIRALARIADQNILVGEGVTGEISVDLHAVPWDQAFQGVLSAHGLSHVWVGGVIRVMTLDDIKHELEMAKIRQETKRITTEAKKVEPLHMKTIKVRYTNATKLQATLERLLTQDWAAEESTRRFVRGSVAVDEDNNTIIINAIADDLVKMVEVIEKLDTPTLQVLVEAHIVETNQKTARELGVQWGGLYKRGDTWITPGANSGGVLGAPLVTVDPVTGALTGIDPTSGMASDFGADFLDNADSSGFTLGMVREKIGKQILTVQLSALQEDGHLNILSSPSITTLDNQVAVIESGTEVPFQTLDDEGDIHIEWKKAVLKLEVTPHVIDGKALKLQISTAKDELDFSRTVLGNPTIITKKATTNLILNDGQTTVIGGLSKEFSSDAESGVPWLKDLPVLGRLFKNVGKNKTMEELLIFITPHILRPDAGATSAGVVQSDSIAVPSP